MFSWNCVNVARAVYQIRNVISSFCFRLGYLQEDLSKRLLKIVILSTLPERFSNWNSVVLGKSTYTTSNKNKTQRDPFCIVSFQYSVSMLRTKELVFRMSMKNTVSRPFQSLPIPSNPDSPYLQIGEACVGKISIMKPAFKVASSFTQVASLEDTKHNKALSKWQRNPYKNKNISIVIQWKRMKHSNCQPMSEESDYNRSSFLFHG